MHERQGLAPAPRRVRGHAPLEIFGNLLSQRCNLVQFLSKNEQDQVHVQVKY